MTQVGAARVGRVERETRETRVSVRVDLDGAGESAVETGVPFFDHMLDALSKHSGIDLEVRAKGDLHIDDHHTVEDVGLTLGGALREALGERRGITRFGSAYAPLDEALARVVVDISGRPYAVYRAAGLGPYVGGFQTYLVEHFLRSLAQEAGIALHVELLYGSDPHHAVEAIFKALALAFRQAVSLTGDDTIPSTKGTL